MSISVQRIDEFIRREGYLSLVDDAVWQQIVDRVLSLYGPQLHYRCVGITQQDDPMGRFSTTFPDDLTVPRRHIKYVEVLISESEVSHNLVEWLHSIGVPSQRVWQTSEECDVGALRIFGYADPKDCTHYT